MGNPTKFSSLMPTPSTTETPSNDTEESARVRAIRAGVSAEPAWQLVRKAILRSKGGEEAVQRWREQHPEQAAAEAEALAAQAQQLPDVPRAPPEDSTETLLRRMRAAGAPERELTEGWLRLYDSPALEAVKDWLSRLEQGGASVLILAGWTGAGKTVAALEALAWGLRQRRKWPAKFATVASLLALSQYGEGGRKWDDAMHASLLVLDELRGESLGDHIIQRRDDLIGHRYSSKLPTVITTNLAPHLLTAPEGPLGARLASRLGERGATQIAGCGKVDRRKVHP